MKKAIYIWVFLLTVFVTGCDQERVIFRGPYFVRFTDSEIVQKESHSGVLSIEVHNAGPALEEDLEIAYSISGDAREGIDYVILSDRENVTIKAGEYVGIIRVQLINNSNNILRSQKLILNLLSVNSNKVKIGQGESSIGTTFTVTIVDDCILGGDYIGRRGSPDVPNITITSTDCELYTLSNWNINVFNTTTAMDLKFTDNGDNTLTIADQEEENLPTDIATIRGTGVVDPVTRIIIMTIVLVDFDDSPEATITLIPN